MSEILPLRYFQVVGESGLFTPDDVAYVQEAGVKAVRLQNHMLQHGDYVQFH